MSTLSPETTPPAVPRNRPLDLAIVFGLTLLAVSTHFIFHGMIVDDSTIAWEWADNFLGRRPLDPANIPEDFAPLYPTLLYLTFQSVGHNLVALHLLPFLASLGIPVLAYLLLRDEIGSRRWGATGGLLVLGWPTAIFFNNQALAEPISLVLLLLLLRAYSRQRITSIIILCPLLFAAAYDSILLMLGLGFDCLLRCRRSPWHARLARSLVVVVGIGAIAVLLDSLVVQTGLFPYDRFRRNLFQRISVAGGTFASAKAIWILGLFFAFTLLPLVMHGAYLDLRHRRRVWGSLPLVGYLAYETILRPSYLPYLVVTLRHLTLTIPGAALLVVVSLRWWAGRWGELSRPLRRGAVAYLVLTLATIFLVQAKYAFFRSGIQIVTDPIQIVRTNPPLPTYVHSCSRYAVEPRLSASIDPIPDDGAWHEIVLDLDRLVNEKFEETYRRPPPKVDRVELLAVRGSVDLASLRVDGNGEMGKPVPLEEWLPLSVESRIGIVRPPNAPPFLRTGSDDGFLNGMAYPLRGGFVAEGRGGRIRIVVRGPARFSINTRVRTTDGEVIFLSFTPRFPTILRDLERTDRGVGGPTPIDRLVLRTYNDLVHWRALGTFRPEGLRTLAPLLDYDYLYYRSGASSEEESSPHHRLETAGEIQRGSLYLRPPAGGEGTLEEIFEFDRPVHALTIAAFASHLVPGDSIVFALSTDKGNSWRELGRAEGVLGRTHWGAEIDEIPAGTRSIRLRSTIRASGLLPDRLRNALPVGIRDIAVAARLEPPEE